MDKITEQDIDQFLTRMPNTYQWRVVEWVLVEEHPTLILALVETMHIEAPMRLGVFFSWAGTQTVKEETYHVLAAALRARSEQK